MKLTKCFLSFLLLFLFIVELGYAGRYYDCRVARFLTPDPKMQKFPSLSPYTYCADNPLKYIDPDGNMLKSVHLLGLTKADPVLKERTYYVDVKIADKIVNFATKAHEMFPAISVNNIYRVENSSDINTENEKAKGLSNHQAGFAVDLNGVKTLTKEQLSKLNELAKENDLSPRPDQMKKDPPHYEAKPTDYGYKDLKAAVDENKKSYDVLTSPPPKKEEEKK